jgi:hypothetical protein
VLLRGCNQEWMFRAPPAALYCQQVCFCFAVTIIAGSFHCVYARKHCPVSALQCMCQTGLMAMLSLWMAVALSARAELLAVLSCYVPCCAADLCRHL